MAQKGPEYYVLAARFADGQSSGKAYSQAERLAFQTDAKGVDLGTGCNKLHLKGPMVMIPRVTYPQSVNGSGYTPYTYNLLPWTSAMANMTVTIQAAWTDSKTGNFALSQARENVLPGGQLPASFAKRAAVSGSNQTRTTGSLYGSTAYYGNPAAAYTYK